MLDDRYPVSHFSISDLWFNEDSNLNSALKEVTASSLPGEPPPILLGSQLPNDVGRVFQIGALNDPYQQDLGQAYFNPATGETVYRAHDWSASRFAMCGVETGPELETNAAGGDIEVLPTGLCVVGNQKQSAEKLKISDACGSESDFIGAPNGFLQVGHTDELIKVMPNRKARPGECDFALLYPSPDAAIAALRASPEASFYGKFKHANKDLCQAMHERLIETRKKSSPEYKKYQDEFQKWKSTQPPDAQGRLWNIFMPTAFAFGIENKKGFVPPPPEPDLSQPFDCGQHFTNSMFVEAFVGETAEYNARIQEQINTFKGNILARLRKRGLTCNPKIIDAPALFRAGSTYLPNMVNSVSVNKAWLVPQQFNSAFSAEGEKIATQLGLKMTQVDTSYLHIKGGNLHCVTQVFRYCRP